MKKLYKTEGPYKMVAGVCGGIAEYFDVDPSLVRIIWLIGIFFTFYLQQWNSIGNLSNFLSA